MFTHTICNLIISQRTPLNRLAQGLRSYDGWKVSEFRRSDGRIGIRNVVVVAYLVECAHHVAREIQLPFRERDVHLIGFPGCYPNDYSQRMMRELYTNPNVGTVLLLSLGCARFNRFGLEQHIKKSERAF